MHRLLRAALVTLITFATAAEADVVASSDTGVVWGQEGCHLRTARVAPLTDASFFADWIGDLNVHVVARLECLRENGQRFTVRGGERMAFPTLTFDPDRHGWFAGGVMVAERIDRTRIRVSPGFRANLWVDARSDYVALAVDFTTHKAHKARKAQSSGE